MAAGGGDTITIDDVTSNATLNVLGGDGGDVMSFDFVTSNAAVSIDGGGGDDIFFMGFDSNSGATLTGGAGEDTYVWERTGEVAGSGSIITDFDSSEDKLAFQDGADRHDTNNFNGFFTYTGINTNTFTGVYSSLSATFKNVFTNVATSNGHIKTLFSLTTAPFVTTFSIGNGGTFAVGSNFFYMLTGGGSTLFFHKLTNLVTYSGFTNDANFDNLTVAKLSGITGVGTGATEIDATDIILF